MRPSEPKEYMISRLALSLVAIIILALGMSVSGRTYLAHAANSPENLVVTSGSDDWNPSTSPNPCPVPGASDYTLRCAIAQANADCPTAGSPCDTITFDIPQTDGFCANPTTIQAARCSSVLLTFRRTRAARSP